MLGNDLIELITETLGAKNILGDPIISKSYTQVFADKLPINMNEMYQSHAQGIRPAYKFNIRRVEYANQMKVRYPISTGVEYDVIRSYTKDDEWLELTIQGVVVNGNA